MAKKPVPGTPSWLREPNDRTALALLLEHGALTRNRLGELTGLSKPTAAQMVARLERRAHRGGRRGLRRPRPERGQLRRARRPRARRRHRHRRQRHRRDRRRRARHASTRSSRSPSTARAATAPPRGATCRAAIEAACSAAAAEHRTRCSVVSHRRAGRDRPAHRRALLHRHPPRLAAHGRAPAARGRARPRGAHRQRREPRRHRRTRRRARAPDTASFALLWMGDGLGLAVDLGGTVHRGAAGGAGEIGYLPVPREASAIDPDGEDLQDLLGGEAVARLARQHGVTGDARLRCSPRSPATRSATRSSRPSPRASRSGRPRARRARPRAGRARRPDRHRRRRAPRRPGQRRNRPRPAVAADRHAHPPSQNPCAPRSQRKCSSTRCRSASWTRSAPSHLHHQNYADTIRTIHRKEQ